MPGVLRLIDYFEDKSNFTLIFEESLTLQPFLRPTEIESESSAVRENHKLFEFQKFLAQVDEFSGMTDWCLHDFCKMLLTNVLQLHKIGIVLSG